MSRAIHNSAKGQLRRLLVAVTASLALHLALWLPLTSPGLEPRTGTGTGDGVDVTIVAAPLPLPLSSGAEPVQDEPEPERTSRSNSSASKPRTRGDPAGDREGTDDGSADGVSGGLPGGVSGGEPGGELGGDDRISGTMVVRCVRAADGALEDCRIMRSLPKVGAAVMRALETWRLPPLPHDDRPNAVDHVISVRLLLPITASR